MKTKGLNVVNTTSAVNAGPIEGTISLQAVYKNGWKLIGFHRLVEAVNKYWDSLGFMGSSGIVISRWTACPIINLPGVNLWMRDGKFNGFHREEKYGLHMQIPVKVNIEFLCKPLEKVITASGEIVERLKNTSLTFDLKYIDEPMYEIPEDIEAFRKLYKIVEIEGCNGSVGINPGNYEVDPRYRRAYGFIGTWIQCQNLVGSMFMGGVVEDFSNTSPRKAKHYGIWVEEV